MLTIGPARPGPAPDRVLTREEVADLFRVSPRTIQRWGQAVKLRSLRASDVDELINPPKRRAPPRAARVQGPPA